MKLPKFMSTAAALALSVGMLGTSLPAVNTSAANKDVQSPDLHAQESHTYGGVPVDLALANDERLIEMLKKGGKIASDATPAEAEKALNEFLKKKAEGLAQGKGELDGKREKVLNEMKEQASENGLVNGKGNKLGHTKEVKGVEEEEWNGGQRVDKVLALLIEYPDFPASSIKAENTDMYYDEYTKEHYTDMLFSDDGYEGPSGEKLVSVKQFYEEQSGGSYSIEGEVAGWYKASKPAAAYGGNNSADNDKDARGLVKEALIAAAADSNLDLSQYDQEDRYDLDGDGNLREPDGLIDHLMIVHSSVGEEAGGGQLGGDAIWSHRWSLEGVTALPGTQAEVPYWGGAMAAYDYTIEPADGAAGVFAHEYGHDLGLPDEYDTIYSGAGEAVSYWSIMASGSWAGDIPGTEPTGFSAWSKEFLQGTMGNSNWLTGQTIHADDVNRKGVEVLLDEAVTKGKNHDAVRVNLPDKVKVINTPAAGDFEYYGGTGDEADHKMATTVDLTNAGSATLDFDVWYNIEGHWDFGMVQVSEDGGETWTSLSTPNTTSEIVEGGYPAIQQNMPGYTGTSDGWINESINLDQYAGKEIMLQFRYMTDWGTALEGMFVDNISVKADSSEVLFDGAEEESAFAFDGFDKHSGSSTSPHYYLLEWRSHNGVDEGLSHIRRGDSLMTYDSGLVVWYVDEGYDNNWTGMHPGDGFLGVVDADQHTNYWSDGAVGSTRYQVHDAAFSLAKTEKMFLDYTDLYGFTMTDNHTKRTPLFDDSADYSNIGLVDAGRNVPEYGLKFRVTGQSADGTVGKVLIYK